MFKSLQIYRAFAAVLVVLFHLGGNLAKTSYFGMPELAAPLSFGHVGVELFFVLSGFIIFYAHCDDFGKPDRLLNYCARRVIRIYPVYWLIFLPVFIIALVVPSMRTGVPHDFVTVVKSLLLIPQDAAVVGGTGAPVIIAAWSLQYEIVFYAFLAVFVFNRKLALISSFLLASLWLFGRIVGIDSFPFFLSFLMRDYVLLFGMGMLVAWLVRGWGATLSICALPLFWVGVILFFVSIANELFVLKWFFDIETLVYGLSAALIVLGLVLAERFGQFVCKGNFLSLLGDASYALYLIHFPLLSLLCKIVVALGLIKFGVYSAIPSFFVIFVICVAVSMMFHVWLEKPLLRYLQTKFSSALV